MDRSTHRRGRLPTSARLAIAMALALIASLPALGVSPPTVEANGVCSSGPRTLSNFGDRVYPDQGNGGYTSVHTDLYIYYDTATNLFLPGTRADLTIRTTQCLTDFSFDFERTAMSGSASGPNMTVDSVAIGGSPTTFDFRQPTYPGNPNGPDDPDPLAHAISNVNPVSATNPLPPACSPQTSGNSQNGLPCPANKLVITPSSPIPADTTMTVSIAYSGRPGTHVDGDGSTEGWFRINTTAAPNDGSFVTTEPVGSMAWMPLNNHPTAKPTYDVVDTVPVGKTAIGPGHLVGATPGPTFEALSPTSVNPPDANFPGGSWTWHWHSPEPIANYLVTNSIGSYDLTAMTSPTSGIEYYQALASGLTDARKATIRANIDQLESMIEFQENFAGPYPFTTAGVIVALPSVGFAEEMQTKITFGNGATSTPSIGTLNHEAFHQWFGDNVAEGGFRLTFWKEGWATVGSYLATARDAATAVGGLGTPAGDAAFDTSLINRFNGTGNYGTTSNTFWNNAPSNPTVGNLFTTASTYTRPGTAYLALRQILDSSASRPASDRWIGAMKQIQHDFGGRSITESQLENIFHQWLPNQSTGCHTKLDTFFTQWFDTPYPGLNTPTNKPQITGPGLNGPDKFYDDASDCTRADQVIDFGGLPNRSPGDPDFEVSASSDSGLPVSFSADGPCTVTGTTVHLTGDLGTCTITASQAGDGVFKPASVPQAFEVHAPVVTNDAPGGTASVQYSDALGPTVTVSASDAGAAGSSLSAVASGLPDGLSLAVGTTSPDGTSPGTRTWTVDGATTAAPGSYPVSVIVTNDLGVSGSTSFTIEVTQEDADATYTGDALVFTAPAGSTASVLLAATIRDSEAIPGSGDTAGGDIRNATVTFSEGGTTLCGPLPATLIDGTLTTGTASCTVSLAVGLHAIDIAVGGYYSAAGEAIVVVAQPDGSFVTGGGHLVTGTSAGSYPADPGTKTNFGFDVKYKGKAKDLKGHISVHFRIGDRTYELKSKTIDSLGVASRTPTGDACTTAPSATCWGVADLRGTATLTDVTKVKPGPKPPKPRPAILSGLTLKITLTDQGKPKGGDSIGIAAWNGGTLVFSSAWNGATTVEMPLDGGNVVVH